MNMQPIIDPTVVHVFYRELLWVTAVVVGIGLFLGFSWWFYQFLSDDNSKAYHFTNFGDFLRFIRIRAFLPGKTVHSGRRVLWWGLGILWLVDGILQAQPAMPNDGFVEDVLAPAIQGQPIWYVRVLAVSIQFWTDHPIGADVVAVILQIGIGLLLLVGKERTAGKIGIWLSIVWGLAIWVFGEGMGGILTGSATSVTGAPGSALFYVIGAILLLLPDKGWLEGNATRTSRWIFSIFWLMAAMVQAWPSAGFWTSKGLSSVFEGAASMPQPSWMSAPIDTMARLAASHPVFWNGWFVLFMFLLGIGFAVGGPTRPVLTLSLVWLAFTWWMGQDFGVMGGVGTDPNSSPVLALLIITLWKLGRVRSASKRSQNTSLHDISILSHGMTGSGQG
ncbi:hypothetical protein JZ785_04175 [Alicyclobacillus curvatus]|nr:hypothetical protein JZ785_04175 [Alicyclobacillus curvatus]